MVQRGDYFRLHAFWAGLFLMCGAVVISGCGREEPAKAPEEAPPKVSKRVEGPQTRVLLQRMPDEAAAALATPSLSGPYLMALGLWERAQADPAAFREKIGASAQEWADAWGVAVDAQDHLDVLRAVGVDIDAAAAVFVDGDSFAPQAESTKARQSEIDASDGAEAPPTAAKENGLPVGAAIIRCNDVERAEKALPGLVARAFAQPVTRESTDVAGIAMEQLSPAPFWYLFENKHLILGTSPEFVAAVVRKRDNPTPVRYGTPECPVDSDGEIVALARLAEMHKLEHAAQGQGPGPVVGLVMGQLLPSSGKGGAQISDDPLVTTLALEENRVALHSRLDVEKHPELLKLWGAPPRIDYLGLMPQAAKGVLSVGLTPEWKALLLEGIQKSSPDDPTAGALVETLLNAMGDEITVAVTGTRDDLPVFVLLAEITQPDLFKGIVGLSGGKLVPVNEGSGDEIMKLEVPMELPTPVFAKMGENYLFVANDLELLREIHATQKNGGPSEFLASFAPPVELEVPRYSLLLLSESGIREVLAALLLDPAVRAQYGPALAMVRELRASQELEGPWQTTTVDLHLN